MELVQIYFKNWIKNCNHHQFPCIFSVFIWKYFILDPDPNTGGKMDADPCGSGSTALMPTITTTMTITPTTTTNYHDNHPHHNLHQNFQPTPFNIVKQGCYVLNQRNRGPYFFNLKWCLILSVFFSTVLLKNHFFSFWMLRFLRRPLCSTYKLLYVNKYPYWEAKSFKIKYHLQYLVD